MKCRELLESGGIACVECGTRIGEPDAAPTNGGSTNMGALAANRNTLSYHEDRNSRRFEASLTDSAMHGLGDVFGELFAQRGAGRTISQPQLRTTIKEEVVFDGAKQLPPPTPSGNGSLHTPEGTSTSYQVTDKDRVLKIFSATGETLELTDNRLKAKSAADYYRRLTYLFLYAQELHGRTATPRADLINVLKEAKVYDANCRTWLKQKKGFTLDGEDRLKLIAGAREQAIKALDEALDPNVPDVWNPDNKAAKPRSPRKKRE